MGNRQEQNLKDLNVSLTERLETLAIELQGKNRELEIEAALEKVRVRATAMRISSELAETSAVLFQQIHELNIKALRTGVGIFDDANDAMEIWLTTFSDSQEVIRILDYVNLHIHPVYENIIHARTQNNPYAVTILNGDQVRQYYHTMSTYQFLPQPQQFNSREYFYSFFFSEGAINVISLHALTEEECNIMIRFSQVFGLIYTRFLDLQKSEAQGKEAQIELGLERVRAKALAMQKSDDLANAVAIIFEELDKLSMGMLRCGIGILNKEARTVNVWAAATSDKNVPVQISGDESMDMHPLLQGAFDAWLKQEDYSYELEGEDLNAYYKAQAAANFKLPDLQALTTREGLRQYYFLATFQAGGVFAFRDTPFPEETRQVMKRFAGVLNLTYQRFADLQSAEAQAREAKIEAALEKVRSRSLAMHKSDELQEVVHTVFEKLKELDVELYTAIIFIFTEGTKDIVWWLENQASQQYPRILVPYVENPYLRDIFEAKEKGKVHFSATYSFEEKNELFQHLFENTGFKYTPDAQKEFLLKSEFATMSVALAKNTGINITSYTKKRFSDKENEILKRFAKVFDQAYTRFLDLQKAEAQAREAQIELGLERVRARAMAMQNSDELSALVAVLFEELTRLNLNLYRCIIWIFNPDTLAARMWMANSEDKGNAKSYFVKKLDHPYYDAILKGWEEKKAKWVYELQGNDKKTIDQLLFNETELANLPSSVKTGILSSEHTVVCGSFNNFGLIEASGPEPQSDEQLEIISRFGKVFDLTYTRFNDLKKAEARALEAIKQSSLDRVRAEIASMRTTSDLQRITPIIWQELTMLEVPFFRCGVFIVDEIKTEVKIYLSAPDGHSLGVMQLPFDANSIITNSVDHWRKGFVYTEHWDKEAFVSWMNAMINQGQIKNPEVYQDSAKPPESLHLHFVPFSQGMLYIGNSSPLPDEKIDLVKSLAEAFSIAYARYEDFNKLEAAKEQIEKTLVHLKQAQSQLIQSEKMASLGELTAGIAHEIQNPLNFVNNFSEVSAEMMEELQKEFIAGNQEEGVALVTDIKLNLEKILHHGKRADAIVKGMLQHTRSSTGRKEPTDINALAEEYLRLAYHGLRAKDKMFNATIETYFDDSIGEIDIIPQDIGRVILNLINNAFYAVAEKKKEQPEGFEPLVSVFTKKLEDKVSISVKDNGNGIPQQIADKIFQPFFTTKPAGQGTGLGLSLSYDIVKAHGGELQMNTEEGKGTVFNILLPN